MSGAQKAIGMVVGIVSRTAMTGRAASLAAALAIACMAGPDAAATDRLAQALDVPEQIAPDTGGDRTRIEEIPSQDGGDPIRAEQFVGGRDLCDPSVSEAERRRHGVDCEAIERREREGLPPRQGQAGTADDPLLQPRDREAREEFDALELGDDVPATIILQK